MRVLHLTLSLSRGGRRDAILMLITSLRKLGVVCGLAGLRDGPEEAVPLAESADFVAGFGVKGRPGLRQIFRLRRFCIQNRVELIHSHDAGAQYVASMLRIVLPGLRSVMTHHRTLGLTLEGTKDRLRNLLTLPAVDRVLTASEDRRRFFISATGISPDRVSVIPMGTNLDRFHPDPIQRAAIRAELGVTSQTLLVVAAGHFGPEKGIDQVLEAAGTLRQQPSVTPWHLVILGSGSPEQVEAMRSLARSRLGDAVTLVGFRQDIHRWFQGADLMLHAPRQEAFGLVVVQAMACGTPVAAMGVGGVAEIIEDGVSGSLVPSGDTAALARSASRILADPVLRSRLAEGALAQARSRFSAARCAELHAALYRRLLNVPEGTPDPGGRGIPAQPITPDARPGTPRRAASSTPWSS